jgi:hypothetical protein
MAREGTPDPVSDAFQRVSQDEPVRQAHLPPAAHQPIDWVIAALSQRWRREVSDRCRGAAATTRS